MEFDQHFQNVGLLLHGDGINGGTVFVDSSQSNKTPSATVSVETSTAQAKFGTASIRGTATTGANLSYASSSAFSWASGTEATFEFFIYCQSGIALGGYFMAKSATLYCSISGAASTANASIGINGYASVTLALQRDQWHHVAITRFANNTSKVWLNGVNVGGSSIPANDGASSFGVVNVPGREDLTRVKDVYIDELRWTQSVARYTVNFTPPTEAFPDSGPPNNAYIAVVTPLAAPDVLAQTVVVASAQLHAIIGSPALFAVSGHFAFAAATSPIGQPSAIALAVLGAYTQAPTPLAAPSVLAEAAQFAKIAVGTPLQQPQVLAVAPYFAHALAPSPMRAPKSLAWHDFTGQIGDTVTRYLMDLITPSGTVRVPISSWQSTLRTGASSYVQCVIPAAQQWCAAINAATSFRILRRAVTTSGQVIEYLMAEAPADTPQFDRGPTNHTCTLSGYAPGFAAQDVSPGTDRTLTGIRSISSGASYRVRCAVDWLLRPGQRGVVDGVPFVVEWINYYVNTTDAYMEAGT